LHYGAAGLDYFAVTELGSLLHVHGGLALLVGEVINYELIVFAGVLHTLGQKTFDQISYGNILFLFLGLLFNIFLQLGNVEEPYITCLVKLCALARRCIRELVAKWSIGALIVLEDGHLVFTRVVLFFFFLLFFVITT